MRFRKPWLGVKSFNFNFSAESSRTDHNKLNKPTPKNLAHMGSEKSLVEHGVPKTVLFPFSHFSLYWKVYFSLWAIDSVKSSSTDYNESNKPNPKSLAHIGSKKSFVELGVSKNERFHFFHIFRSTEKFTFSP